MQRSIGSSRIPVRIGTRESVAAAALRPMTMHRSHGRRRQAAPAAILLETACEARPYSSRSRPPDSRHGVGGRLGDAAGPSPDRQADRRRTGDAVRCPANGDPAASRPATARSSSASGRGESTATSFASTASMPTSGSNVVAACSALPVIFTQFLVDRLPCGDRMLRNSAIVETHSTITWPCPVARLDSTRGGR